MKKKNIFKKAKKIVLKNNNYSISFLQRTLGIGWNRASGIMPIIKLSILIEKKRQKKHISKKKKSYKV